MSIPGNLLTTAMAVMPHRAPERAQGLALSLDIPYWPQLPLYSYYEDMYVQASEHFPGIVRDLEKRKLSFSEELFHKELEQTLAHFDQPEYFDISENYSSVYHKFLEMDLSSYPAIRGQLEGPISFGFNIMDQDDRPILFNDTVRPFLLEFMAKRINIQLKKLKSRNEKAFMFVDEPGLQFIFSAMSGYNDIKGKEDMEYFFSLINRPRGIHLCGNPDWDFLLQLDLDILSLDTFSNGERFVGYASSIKKFLDRGGVIVWGMVPTNYEPFSQESLDSLASQLEILWEKLASKGIDKNLFLSKSLLSPATCCLVNPDKTKTVEQAFSWIKDLSKSLRIKYGLNGQ
jgi:hypothetical protein